MRTSQIPIISRIAHRSFLFKLCILAASSCSKNETAKQADNVAPGPSAQEYASLVKAVDANGYAEDITGFTDEERVTSKVEGVRTVNLAKLVKDLDTPLFAFKAPENTVARFSSQVPISSSFLHLAKNQLREYFSLSL